MEFFFDYDWVYTNEDFLVLNLWTPGILDGKKSPVLFWIHEGFFTAESSQELPSYHGENLSKLGDVVAVSVNHRLNTRFFLDLSAYGEEYKYSANHSILDLRVALEWVQANIENLGVGSRQCVDLRAVWRWRHGEHLNRGPSEQGLYHKAVNQSSSFRMDILELGTMQAIAKEVLKELALSPQEVEHHKTISFVELAAKGNKALKTVEVQLQGSGAPIPGLWIELGSKLRWQLIAISAIFRRGTDYV